MGMNSAEEKRSSDPTASQSGSSVPIDWSLLPIKKIAATRANAIVGGPFGSDLVSRDYVAVGVPVIRGQNMARHYISGDFAFVSQEKAKQLQANTARAGDLIFTQRGTLGQVALVPAGSFEEYVVSQSQMKLTLNPRVACAEYVYQYFVSPWGQKQVIDSAIQTGVPHTNLGILQNYEILLPPTLNEQQAIVEALSDADALIESLSLLLTKKRQIKQGAMQELLTGKRRLPRFDKPWIETNLGSLGRTYGGLTGKTKSDFGQGQARYITFMNVIENVAMDSRQTEAVDVKVGETQNIVSIGDLLFNGSSETPEEVALCSYVAEEAGPLYLNSFCFGFRPHDRDGFCGLFMAYFFRSLAGRQAISTLAQGATRYNISKTALLQASLCLPSTEERRAIVEVLSSFDSDIAAVELRVAKARDLKQGMMQALLTGRIRLVQRASNVIPLPIKPTTANPSQPQRNHNWQINEAVVIGVLAQRFGTEKFPLPRKRRVKLMYLLHRHAEGRAEGYLKKAAGPYDPNTKYKGPEQIALKNGYVRALRNDKYEGFVAGGKIDQAQHYFEQWYGAAALVWLERFRYRKTDELELLATVDMALVDLVAAGRPPDVAGVKRVIAAHPEWVPKLSRDLFSDERIAGAIAECQTLFSGPPP